MPVWWLVAHGLGPDFEMAAATDDDGDGMDTCSEFLAGTSPKEAFPSASELGCLRGASGLSWQYAAFDPGHDPTLHRPGLPDNGG